MAPRAVETKTLIVVADDDDDVVTTATSLARPTGTGALKRAREPVKGLSTRAW
jgi:hypothetical protein